MLKYAQINKNGCGMGNLKNNIKKWLKIAVEFCLNPRMLLCFGIGWMITNGWAYIATALGLWFGIEWLFGIGAAYLTALWIPFTPEKIITVIIAIFLLKKLFPNDKKTLERLHKMKEGIKAAAKKYKARRQEKKLKALAQKKAAAKSAKKNLQKQKRKKLAAKKSRRINRA